MLEKMASTCLLCLSPEKIEFFMAKEFTNGEQAFLDIRMSSLFDEIIIVSLNENRIPLQLEFSNFARALRSATNSVAVVVKLAKNGNQPVLNFSMQRNQQSELTSTIQDVPVTVEPINRLQDVREPDIPAPKVKFLMPKLRVLSRVLDKLKSINDTIIITGSNTGTLEIGIQTDLCVINTFFKNLQFDDSGIAPSTQDTSTISVSAKKLTNIMHVSNLNPRHVIGCLVRSFI
jgi:hypothetical protein